MMFKVEKITVVLVFIASLFFLVASIPVSNHEVIIHKLNIKHKAKPFADDIQLGLNEIKNKSGFTIAYSMKVPSVYCADVVCKIDTVELFWDNIGRYKSFKLSEGVQLEKSKGEPFTQNDYIKLNAILADSKSELKDLRLKPVADEAHDVDAIVGATTINANSTVKGALWTSYTLWHFVYGSAFEFIKDYSKKSFDNDQLVSFIKDSTETYPLFALEELKQRRAYDEYIIRIIIEQTLKGSLTIQNTLSYLENSTDLIYQKSIYQLYCSGNNYQRIQCLNSLKNSSYEINEAYLLTIFDKTIEFNSYQEIDVLLNIFEYRNFVSKHLNTLLFAELNSKNKLIARRIYWYLIKNEMNTTEIERLKNFKKENELFF